jgi:hypothetical protein
MSGKSLASYIAKLEETLEEKPDKWFDNPKGTNQYITITIINASLSS